MRILPTLCERFLRKKKIQKVEKKSTNLFPTFWLQNFSQLIRNFFPPFFAGFLSTKHRSFEYTLKTLNKRETFLPRCPFVIHHVTMIFFNPLFRVCQTQRDNNSSSSQVSNLKNAYVIYPLSWKLLLIKTLAINTDHHHWKLHSHYFTLSMHFLVDRELVMQFCIHS